MRAAALCDRHSKLFEEPEDPTNRSFFSEIISSISDVKLSNNGRYMISRDYLSVKVWDLHMETKPIETYPVSKVFIYLNRKNVWHNSYYAKIPLLRQHKFLSSKITCFFIILVINFNVGEKILYWKTQPLMC